MVRERSCLDLGAQRSAQHDGSSSEFRFQAVDLVPESLRPDGGTPNHIQKERPVYTILLTKRQQSCILTPTFLAVMVEARPKPLNVVCFATFFKGGDFMRECYERGCRVVLITKEKMLEEDWPRDVLDDLFAVPNDAPVELFLDLVSHIASHAKPDRIIALEEFDVVMAALAREHLCVAGMGSVTAKTFRDKLSMSVKARAAGIKVPEFVPGRR